MTEEEIKAAVEKALANLKSDAVWLEQRAVHTNWLVVVVGVVILAVLLYFFIDRHYSYEQSVVEAKAQEKIAEAQKQAAAAEEKARQDSNKALLQQIAATQKSIADLAKKSLERDTQAQARIAEVTQPNRPAEQVAKDSTDYLNVTPVVTAAGLTYTPAQVQIFIATKIDRDNLQLKVKDLTTEITTQAGVITKCTASIDQANQMAASYQKLVEEKDATIQAYKKAAVKSGWQKVWDTAQKVLYVAAGIGIGAAIYH